MGDVYVGFKATKTEKQKVKQLARATGLTESDVLRRLLASAEVKLVQRPEPVANTEMHPGG